MKRLVFLVEGEGDTLAVPALVGRLVKELPAELRDQLFVDDKAFKVGNVDAVTGRRQPEWHRFLNAARKTRKNLGAVLAVFDGDADEIESHPFCAVQVARHLAERGRAAAAGVDYSLAVVFLCQEYESFLLASVAQLPGMRPDAVSFSDAEAAPRNAKGELAKMRVGGYSPTRNQLDLTRAVTDWTPARQLSSFQRLESALAELARAVQTGVHVSTPAPPTA